MYNFSFEIVLNMCANVYLELLVAYLGERTLLY